MEGKALKQVKFATLLIVFCLLFTSCTVYVSNYHIGDALSPVIVSASCEEKHNRNDKIALSIGLGREQAYTAHQAILTIDAPGLVINDEYPDRYEYEITDFSDIKYRWEEKGDKIKAAYFETVFLSVPENLDKTSGKINISLFLYSENTAESPYGYGSQITLYYDIDKEHIIFRSFRKGLES